MKSFQIVLSVILISLFTILCSCGSDEESENKNCIDEIVGVWDVVSFSPSTADCSSLVSYEIGTTADDNILTISLDEGGRRLEGTGVIDDDCSQLLYTVSEGQTIESGDIRFNGSTFEDRSDFGCLVNAEKR